jgi:hypothetical protein
VSCIPVCQSPLAVVPSNLCGTRRFSEKQLIILRTELHFHYYRKYVAYVHVDPCLSGLHVKAVQILVSVIKEEVEHVITGGREYTIHLFISVNEPYSTTINPLHRT